MSSICTRWLGLLALVLGALSAPACNHLEISNRAEARDVWKKSYTLERGGTLEVRTTNGKVTIESTDGPGIDVVADRIVQAASDDAAKKELARMEISESTSPKDIVLDATNKGLGVVFNLSRRVDFTIKAPRWANITVKTTNGDISATGVAGILRADTTNGRVHGAGLESGAEVETTNGTVSLEFARLGERGVRCRTTNGTIDVTLPKDSAARISARVTNGAISTSDLPLTILEQSRRRLDATLGSGGPDVRLETTNGAIGIKGK